LLQTATQRYGERHKMIGSGLDDGSRIAAKSKGFLFSTTLRPNLGPNTNSFSRLFSDGMRSEREADLSVYLVLELGMQCCLTPVFHKPQHRDFYAFEQILSFILNTSTSLVI
jgi:hypothetical protein